MEGAAECLKVSKVGHICPSPVRNFRSSSPDIQCYLSPVSAPEAPFCLRARSSKVPTCKLHGSSAVCALHCQTQAPAELCPALFQKEGVQGKIQKQQSKNFDSFSAVTKLGMINLA